MSNAKMDIDGEDIDAPAPDDDDNDDDENGWSLCTPSMVTDGDFDNNGFVDQVELLQLLTQMMQQGFENCPEVLLEESSASVGATSSVTDLLETLNCVCLPFHAQDDFEEKDAKKISMAAWNCCRRTANGQNFAAPGIYDKSYDDEICDEINAWVASHVERVCRMGGSIASMSQLLIPLLNQPNNVMDLDLQEGTLGGTNVTLPASTNSDGFNTTIPYNFDDTTTSGSVLTTVRYYEYMRQQAERVMRPLDSNMDYVVAEKDQVEFPLCHLPHLTAFTTPTLRPIASAHEELAIVALALEHLNTGNGILVPQLDNLHEQCPIKFTTEHANTKLLPDESLRHILAQTARDPTGPLPFPCAYLGAWQSDVSASMSLVTAVLGYPQISWASTSMELSNAQTHPLFARIIPPAVGMAVPLASFVQDVYHAHHLAVITLDNDAMAQAMVEALERDSALTIHYVTIADDMNLKSVEEAFQSIKNSQYRFILVVLNNDNNDGGVDADEYRMLLEQAYQQGVAGTGEHTWLFADTATQSTLKSMLFDYDDATNDGSSAANSTTVSFEMNGPLHLALQGAAVMEVAGGVEGMPAFETFEAELKRLRNPSDLQYLASKLPTYIGQGEYGNEIPFLFDDDYLMHLHSFGPLLYESVIALGLSACSSYRNDSGIFTLHGDEHFSKLINSQFTGISGTVKLDNETRTRDPDNSLYRVINLVVPSGNESVNDETTTSQVYFVGQTTNLFKGGVWNEPMPYVFNDGTTNLPADVGASEVDYVVVVTLPIVFVFLLIVVFFLVRKSRKRAVWLVVREDLEFGDPPEVIGRGTFGLVVLAEYQGTLVAVKRVRPIKKKKSKKSEVHPSNVTEDAASKRASIIYVNGTEFDSTVLKVMKQDFMKETRYLAQLRHPCIAGVVGGIIDKDEPMLVMEYLDRGSLHDILHNDTVRLEGEISVLPILDDIIQGLTFLHSKDPEVIHGDLKATNVLIDVKFRAKLADFGYSQKRTLGIRSSFWMAPELLKDLTENTTASDVYAFGIVLYEVYSRRNPYAGENEDEVIRQVADKAVQKRPPVPRHMPQQVRSIMSDCLEYDPGKRPTLEELDTRLKRIERESMDLVVAVDKSAKLSMYDTFPRKTAGALTAGESVEPEYHDCATIYFADIIGFENLSAQLPRKKMENLLHRLYSKFDKLSFIHGVFTVDTGGNAYMAVANIAKEQPNDHAKRIAEFSIATVAAANKTYIDEGHKERGYVNIRVGFHSGPCVAEVIGKVKPQYCIFGDTVNTARRLLDSNSEANKIHCSKRAAKLLMMQSEYIPLSFRGKTSIKGTAKMDTFWVNEGTVGNNIAFRHMEDSFSSFLDLESGEKKSNHQVRPKADLEPLQEVPGESLDGPTKSMEGTPATAPASDNGSDTSA